MEQHNQKGQQQNQKGQYKCDCGKSFETQSELRQHESQEHKAGQGSQKTQGAGGQSRSQ